MLKIYHNPRCSKSRQTLEILKEKDIQFQIIEYLKDTPSKEELRSVINKLNLDPIAIVRKGESIYKEKFKGKNYSNEEWIDILLENPKLIERPIVFDRKKAVIGRPPENVNVFY